ncbi:helix-turn-helix domain-containing protein [Clostridium butyricum]|uniref:helix-turn-helix domain-containing protein n=1 Tax=Clostridium butyricum TaxID=1492 RepID=UPI002AB2E3E3|nr:helix-turn-helix domain-containing protein [Clostridium butyricum]
MEDLLTIKDLAKHWKCHEETIREHIRQGILTPCKNVPVKNRFNPSYIAELDGVELERFSPVLKRNMENELEKVKRENEKLKIALREYQVISAKSLELLT